MYMVNNIYTGTIRNTKTNSEKREFQKIIYIIIKKI